MTTTSSGRPVVRSIGVVAAALCLALCLLSGKLAAQQLAWPASTPEAPRPVQGRVDTAHTGERLSRQASGHASSQAPTQSLRLGLVLDRATTLVDDGAEEIRSRDTGVSGFAQLQLGSGLYGEVQLASRSRNWLEVDDVRIDLDEPSQRLAQLGIGLRIPADFTGNYIGAGYRHTRLQDEEDEPAHGFLVFVEHDSFWRHDRLQLIWTHDDPLDMLSIAGQHTWFSTPGAGLGMIWMLGLGELDGNDIGTAALGLQLVFRPGF